MMEQDWSSLQREGRQGSPHWLALWLAALLVCHTCHGQRASAPDAGSLADGLTYSTDAVEPMRFIAAHGQRAVMMGYPANGLEMWAYPLQVFDSYRIDIRTRDAASATPGSAILRRIEVRPQDATRIYIGPGFVVRERLFIPLDRPGAIVTFSVEGRPPVDITVHFRPVLDLMWPASLGGQSAQWNEALGGYMLSEPLHRFTAAVVSPNTVAHDSTENSTQRIQELAFTVRPAASGGGASRATVYVGLEVAPAAAGTMVKELARDQPSLEAASAAHYVDLATNALAIETPDPAMNQALAWAEVALDQAWVCSTELGCGLVAGYGPSRSARRPQYDWFFAGDGLVATDGLVAVGEYERARQELEFILKYQDAKDGMIWHELSQSAGYLDWVGKYPYMYVHVDVTFQFLSAVARYVVTSGDVKFARQHWAALAAAYGYCRALIDPATRLPRIPAGKEGGNEQDRMSDDLGLSAAWVSASSAFAELARATGHATEAAQAEQASEAARPHIAERYWDAGRQFWISGHTDGDKPIFEERSGSGLLTQHVFTTQQDDTMLDKLASADFQSDWGSRNVSSASPSYDPDAYARGSSFALGTAGMAQTFFAAHRPVTARSIWSTLAPLTWLDAPGHIPEVLAGDVYHQQAESVPEQTWSSAAILSATVDGLLGLRIDAAADRLTFAPHLPPDWQHLSVRHVRLLHASLGLQVTRVAAGMEIEVESDGAPTHVVFDPELPLGAQVGKAECGGVRLAAQTENHAEDEHERVEFTAQPGTTKCVLRYRGGVRVEPDAPQPLLGEASRGLKITQVTFAEGTLTVVADAKAGVASGFDLRTEWRPVMVDGGNLSQLSTYRYRVQLSLAASGPGVRGYVHRSVRIRLEPIAGAGR